MKKNKAKLIGVIISMVCAMSLVAVGVMASLTQFKVTVGNQLNLQFDTVEGSLYATRVGDVASAADRSVSKVLSTSSSGTDWMLVYDPLDQDGDGNNVIATAQNSIQESVDFSSDSVIAEKVADGETTARITYYFYYTIPSTGSDIIGTKIQLSTPTASAPATGLSVNYAYKKTSDAIVPNFATGYPMQNGDVVSVNAGENIFIKAELVADLTGTVDVSSVDWEFTLKFVVENAEAEVGNQIKRTDGTIGGYYYYYIELGEYPQTVVSSSSLITSLNALGDSAKTGKTYSIGGEDATSKRNYEEYLYNGEKYIKIESAYVAYTTSQYVFSNGKKAVKGNTYWFKVEPIKWFLLEAYSATKTEYSGSTTNIRVISENALTAYVKFDSFISNDSPYNVWGISNLRNWLNDEFYTTAFDAEDKAVITKTNIRYNGTGNWDTCDDYTATSSTGISVDNVWALSYYEVSNTYYGANMYLKNTYRRVAPSDFAVANSITMDTDGTSTWWLRTAGGQNYFSCYVNRLGQPDYSEASDPAGDSPIGVRPAMVISL